MQTVGAEGGPGTLTREAGSRASIAKPVVDLTVDLPRIVVVKAAEGQAIVQQQMPVGQVQSRYGGGQAFPERLAECQINARMARQMVRRWGTVGKARAVVHIHGRKRLPGKIRVKARIQRVSLVMI